MAPSMSPPPTAIRWQSDTDRRTCILAGDWTVHALARRGEVAARRRALGEFKEDSGWDLSGVTTLDALGALLLWRHWGQRLPAHLTAPPIWLAVFEILASQPIAAAPAVEREWLAPVRKLGDGMFAAMSHGRDLLLLLGQLVLDLGGLLARPHRGPWREISAQLYQAGARALIITAMVGFLIGVVLSFLSAQQLRMFGADLLIVKLLGVSIVRELGPLLAAILVAGRSGSAITAQIGVMRLTQELDALQVMGISHGQRLILPRVVALAIAMPLLVVWTDAMALLGGALAAYVQLNLQPAYFFQALPRAVSAANYWLGVGKGVAFGGLIALVACHFGLRIQPNTDSLGRGTTASVVTAITGVILADAVFAILFRSVGLL